jgi:hypothetical protein
MAIKNWIENSKFTIWTKPQIENSIERFMNSDWVENRHNKEPEHTFKFLNTTYAICEENCKSPWVQLSFWNKKYKCII